MNEGNPPILKSLLVMTLGDMLCFVGAGALLGATVGILLSSLFVA
jgi:hypothetical protein